MVRSTTSARFQINNAKLYVPVVTLSINDNIKFLENIKEGLKRTVSWNKYRSEMTTQPSNNILDYLIDPIFMNLNRLFALSFRNGNVDPTRNSFDKYCMPLVEIKDYNALIDNKRFFNLQKTNKKCMKNLSKCQKMMTAQQVFFLDFSYHQNYYKLIGIDLSRQTNMSIPQQIILTGKLENDGSSMFFTAEKQQKAILIFSLDSLIITE